MWGALIQQGAQHAAQGEGMFWQAMGGLLSAGEKPRIPAFREVTSEGALREAVRANLATFPGAADLTRQTNAFNIEQLQSALRRAIPNYDQLVAGAGRQIGAMVEGRLPQDVVQQINRRTAAQAMRGGYAGSGMARNLEARDLGLTSLQLTQQGINSAMNWIANARTYQMPQLMDLRSMFISPQEQIALSINERDARFQRDLLAAGVAAMPDPRMAALGGAMINYGGARMGSSAGGGGFGGFGGFGGGGGGNQGVTGGPTGTASAAPYGNYPAGSEMSNMFQYGGMGGGG